MPRDARRVSGGREQGDRRTRDATTAYCFPNEERVPAGFRNVDFGGVKGRREV